MFWQAGYQVRSPTSPEPLTPNPLSLGRERGLSEALF